MKTPDNKQPSPAFKFLKTTLSKGELATSKKHTGEGDFLDQKNKEILDISKDARKLKRNITIFVFWFVSVWCGWVLIIVSIAMFFCPNTWVLVSLISGTAVNIVACLKYVIGGIFKDP